MILCLSFITVACHSGTKKPGIPETEPPEIPNFSPGFTTTIYIDKQLTSRCETYSPAVRRCGSGNELAFATISASQSMAETGVNFQIRAGDYKEVLHITASGRAGAYLGYSAYENETVRLIGVNSMDNGEEYGPIWLDQVSYILVSSIEVHGSVGFGRLLNAHHNIIYNSYFAGSTLWNNGNGASKRGGLYISFSHYNRILYNNFYQGTDALAIINSNHNLVMGNRMDLAGHDLWNIKCGSFNVIRNNEFSNKNQKLGSIFDCDENTASWHGNGKFASDEPVYDSSRHNLIEGNIFRDSVKYYSSSGGNGIQYAGQNGIIRHNLFYRVNVGIGMASYRDEATYNYGNRIYNNNFHDNHCIAISIGGPINKMADNEYLNNIIWNNQGLSQENCADTSAKQILFRSRTNNEEHFINNNIASSQGDGILGIWGTDRSYSIAEHENSIGNIHFTDNLETDPLFIDAKNNDYQLSKTSPMIDAGLFLTRIKSESASGTQIQVADISYFYDGFNIPGEKGDLVQIEGRNATAIISAINYQTQTLTLETALTWKKGEKIALSYRGIKPDIGALEY